MSGDVGLDEPIIFYTKKMTQTKVVLLKQKGIKLNWKEVKHYETLSDEKSLQHSKLKRLLSKSFPNRKITIIDNKDGSQTILIL